MVLIMLATSQKALATETEVRSNSVAAIGPVPQFSMWYTPTVGPDEPSIEETSRIINENWTRLNRNEVVDRHRCLYKATFGLEPAMSDSEDADASVKSNLRPFQSICRQRAANSTDLDAADTTFWHRQDTTDFGIEADSHDACCVDGTA